MSCPGTFKSKNTEAPANKELMFAKTLAALTSLQERPRQPMLYLGVVAVLLCADNDELRLRLQDLGMLPGNTAHDQRAT